MEDVLDVVEEELRRIGSEAGRHIEMLYLPNETTKDNRRRHESALQSYIECRLTDRLPGRILDAATEISVHRERQISFRERTDIEVNAPLLHSGLGRVVIEVKWSDNSDRDRNTSIALMKQLGDRYLLADGKTHGIYLVGWNGRLGTWRTEAGNRPEKPLTPQTLEMAFQRQSQEYTDDHDGVRIRPVVIDLAWPHG